MGYCAVKKNHDDTLSHFDTIPACDGRTDVQPISITCFSIADARKNLLTDFKNRPIVKDGA